MQYVYNESRTYNLSNTNIKHYFHPKSNALNTGKGNEK